MTPEEMCEGLAAGKDPLELAIQKWVDIVAHLEQIYFFEQFDSELQQGCENCALCEKYYFCVEGITFCAGCPVYKRTKREMCEATPFEDFLCAKRDRNRDKMLECARRELAFLESLRCTE